MIHLIPTEAKRFRTFGWVQDPSDFRSLCDVVAIFDETSLKHQELAGQVIPALVEERDGRQRLLDALNQRPLQRNRPGRGERAGAPLYRRLAGG